MVCALYIDQGEYDGLCIKCISRRVRWSERYTYIKESTMVCGITRRLRCVRWSVHYT